MKDDPDLKKSLNFLRFCFARGELQHLQEQTYKPWNKNLIKEK